MTTDRGLLRGVAWRDLLPWLVIFRTFRLACSPSVLLTAAAGALLTPVGWITTEALLFDDEIARLPLPARRAFEDNRRFPGENGEPAVPRGGRLPQSLGDIVQTPLKTAAIDSFYWRMTGPLQVLLNQQPTEHKRSLFRSMNAIELNGPFSLADYPAVRAWLERVAALPGHTPLRAPR